MLKSCSPLPCEMGDLSLHCVQLQDRVEAGLDFCGAMIIITFPSLERRSQKIPKFFNHHILRRFTLQKLYNSIVSSSTLKVSLLMNFKVTCHSSTTHPFHTHQNGSRTNVTFATMSSMTPFTLRTIWWSCTVSP